MEQAGISGIIGFMARTSKTPRFEEFNASDNGYGPRAQAPKTWQDNLDTSSPLNLELGCGKAEVSLALAEKYQDQNWIGVDLKADRLWRASKNAYAAKLTNVAFVQANILTIGEFIEPNSVKMIWLTHPDPFPKDRHAKHRMLNRNFLDLYKSVLTDDGIVRFKTDNRDLFLWAIELLEQQKDVTIHNRYDDLHEESDDEDLLIETTFTKKYLARGTKINYLEFSFN